MAVKHGREGQTFPPLHFVGVLACANALAQIRAKVRCASDAHRHTDRWVGEWINIDKLLLKTHSNAVYPLFHPSVYPSLICRGVPTDRPVFDPPSVGNADVNRQMTDTKHDTWRPKSGCVSAVVQECVLI
nr:MAG TPA: hypothetical protein [Caudoviricetes sp.]